MIHSLYTFAVGQYVVADEWNSNFTALKSSNEDCEDAIEDANDVIAFPSSDLSSLYSAVNNQTNSFHIDGDTVTVSPEHEYYKTLSSGESLAIGVPTNFKSEARIWLKTNSDNSLRPFSFSYSGTVDYIDDSRVWQSAGMFMLFLYEANNRLSVRAVRIN